MRLAIMSDIHGNSVAFNKVIEDMQNRNVEGAIILGDFIFKGPNPQEVMDLIMNLNLISCIKGNTDKFLEEITDDWEPENQRESMFYDFFLFMKNHIGLQEVEFIKNLPEKQTARFGKISIRCVHGSPRLIDEGLKPECSDIELLTILEGVEEEIILAGHTHNQYIRQVGGKTIINPGAVGMCNMDEDNRASYAIISIWEDKFDVELVKVEYDHNEIIDVGFAKKFPHLDKYADLLKNY